MLKEIKGYFEEKGRLSYQIVLYILLDITFFTETVLHQASCVKYIHPDLCCISV